MNVQTEMQVQLRQINKITGAVVSETPIQKNLIMDGGLNALARSTNSTDPVNFFNACRVGSGLTTDKTSSGAITFTQATNQLTASAPFFTAGMVGQLFKWSSGTGGNEEYVTAFTSSTVVTVDTSATVVTPTVGVVWNVTRAGLETLLYSSTTYETTAGSCQSTQTGGVVTHKRTFNFANQGTPYSVNEVGYYSSLAGTSVFGRLVLPATEVVNPTNFLQVVLSFVVTYSPAGITAVTNVGTNIDTTGNAMLEQIILGSTSRTIAEVSSTGSSALPAPGHSMDGSQTCSICGIIVNYTQNASVNLTALNPTQLTFNSSLTWTYNLARGQMKLSAASTISTAGQTMYGVSIGLLGLVDIFDVKFTTPFVLPVGSFLPQVTFLVTYNRSLSN